MVNLKRSVDSVLVFVGRLAEGIQREVFVLVAHRARSELAWTLLDAGPFCPSTDITGFEDYVEQFSRHLMEYLSK